jgi:hypothetical protein
VVTEVAQRIMLFTFKKQPCSESAFSRVLLHSLFGIRVVKPDSNDYETVFITLNTTAR